jgi:hypothetical protein
MDTVNYIDIKTEALKQLSLYAQYIEESIDEIDGDADVLKLLQYIHDIGFDVVIIFGSSIMISSNAEADIEGKTYFNRTELSDTLSFANSAISAVLHFINFYFKPTTNESRDPGANESSSDLS